MPGTASASPPAHAIPADPAPQRSADGGPSSLLEAGKRAADSASAARKTAVPADAASAAAGAPSIPLTSPLPGPHAGWAAADPPETAAGAAGAPPPRPAVAVPAERDSTAPPASASGNIQVELTDGGQRVQLRVEDRGGDVRVAVHTADPRLAGALREDLPALAARLEQSGFHTETWHGGGAPASGGQRLAETAARSAGQPSQEQSNPQRQGQQQEPRQGKPRPLENPPDGKSDRKDFTWLFTSIT